jgi:uncharacterized protein with PIN domain
MKIMSCLFRSLSHFIENVNENELRDIIVDYLQKDPILIGNDTNLKDILKIQNSTITEYTQQMRKRHVWGGAIEIRAFCELFDIKVIVFVIRENRNIEFLPSSFESKNECEKVKKCVKISWTGAHYEPMNRC